jgi:hypothetical protein
MGFLREQFGSGYKITAAAFSINELVLAVVAYNAHTLLDTTKVWLMAENPQLIWERTMCNDHTTSLAFGMEDTVLIKAGRFMRVWDVTMMGRSCGEVNFSVGFK